MVRNFQRESVSLEKVLRILELAQRAPSAGFSQGWSYVLVTGADLRRKIGLLQGENDYYAKRRFHKFVSEAPVLIVACVSEELYHERYQAPDKLREDGKEVEWPVPFWYFDMGCACMLIFLAAVNEGLVTAFTGIFRTEQMSELLGIPKHFQPVGVISIGYPARDNKSSSLRRGRRPMREVIHYEHW
jgi:nitroreductase